MTTLAPFGFQAGPPRRSIDEYYVPASDISTYAIGDVVKTNGNVFTGRLPDSRVSSGMLHVTKAASGDAVRGVVVGVVQGPGDGSLQSLPATKQRAYTLLVNDHPQTLWDIQADNTAQLSVMSGMYANYTVGSPQGSVSTTKVDSSTLGTTVRDLVVAEVLSNAGANSLLRVAFVQHELAAAGSSPASAAALQPLLEAYSTQPAVWYAGEISSTVTPTLIADGNLDTATDQVPLKWRVVINADDDVAAAQALLDGTPNVLELLAGVQEQPQVYADDGVTPEVITSIYAVCVSTAVTRPADFTGGAYIITTTGSTLADTLANMARLDFSSGLGATFARLVASQVYNTNFMQLSVAAGVVA